MKVEYSSTTMKQARVLDALRYQLRELNVFTWSMHHPRDLLCIPVTDSHEGPFIAVGFGAVTKNLHAFVFWTASDARDHVNVIEELTPAVCYDGQGAALAGRTVLAARFTDRQAGPYLRSVRHRRG